MKRENRDDLCARLKMIEIQQLVIVGHMELDLKQDKPDIKKSVGTILKILMWNEY